MKDFDQWNRVKKHLESGRGSPFAYPREIWWCSLGLNIGTESDGKNKGFKRPVLILKVYNPTSMFVLPLTTQTKNDRFRYKLEKMGSEEESFVKLTQARVVSNKRLVRKVRTLSEREFANVMQAFKNSF